MTWKLHGSVPPHLQVLILMVALCPWDYFRRAEKLIEEGGLRHLASCLLQKLTAPMLRFGTIHIFMCNLERSLPNAVSGGELTLRQATTADIPLLLKASDASRSAADLERRFAMGHLCFLALDRNGEAAHSRWVSADGSVIPELETDFVPAPREAYFYDGYTRQDFRARGVDGMMRRFIFHWLRSAGFRRAYSYVRGDNPVGLKAARRWQSEVERIGYLRLKGSGTLVFRRRRPGRPLLLKRRLAGTDPRENDYRARLSRAWFESWLKLPLERRSTGFHAVPEVFFEATADFISGALQLDPTADDVLDVGCDSALVSRHVAPRCRRFTGVDLIAGMLQEAPRGPIRTASGRRAAFAAADGRSLPFKSNSFDKVYCCAMIHTLASTDDGLKVIREMVRLCRPGGKVLVASVPDRAKRLHGLLDRWRRSGFPARFKLMASLLLPRRVKQTLRSLLGIGNTEPVLLLEYDVGAIQANLEWSGLKARVLPFPENYWSRDFLRTRSNLLIQVPAEKRPDAVREKSGTADHAGAAFTD